MRKHFLHVLIISFVFLLTPTIQAASPGIFSGLILSEMNDGVKVVEVQPGSPGFGAGLIAGDIILEIEGKKTKRLRDYVEISRELKNKVEVSLVVLREGVSYDATIKLSEINGSTIITDNETATEKQSPPNDYWKIKYGIKGDTNELIKKLSVDAGVVLYGAFNAFGTILWGLIIESTLFTNSKGKEYKLVQVKVKDDRVSIHLTTKTENMVFIFVIKDSYALLVGGSTGMLPWQKVDAMNAAIILTAFREGMSSKLTDKDVEKAIKILENATVIQAEE